MPVFFLFIASLVVFTVRFPERVLYFIRTITKWLEYRQTIRETWHTRRKEVYAAGVEWKAWTEDAYNQLKKLRTPDEKVDWLIPLLAAGQRYLTLVSNEEAPSNYEQTDWFCRRAEKLLAEIRAPRK